MRKLASVQRIWKVESIEGADRIELVHVLGWQCVAKKGEFKKMDLCVYFEIDSFLPIEDRYEFLRSNSYKNSDILGEGFKLKTQRFKGQISQGLVLPLSLFPELSSFTEKDLGKDVTELLHVRKWEIAERISDSGTIIGDRPSFIPKTDETRVQACPELINEFKGKEYYITTKMDGSSHSVGIDEENKFHVTGHNYEYADDGKSTFYEYVKKHDIERKMRDYKNNHSEIKTFAISGEWCGEGIQKNAVGLSKPEWFVFTVYINGERLGLDDIQKIVSSLELTMVPVEEKGTDFDKKYQTVEDLLKRAEGKYKSGKVKEGIVIRPVTPVYSKLVEGPLSMKAVSNVYLTKKHEK